MKKRKRWDAKAYRAWMGEKYRKLFKQGHEARELITVSQRHSDVRGIDFKRCFDGVVECTRSAIAHAEEICGGAVEKDVNGSRDKDRGSTKEAAVVETEQYTSTGGVLLSEVPCVEFREEQLEEGLEKRKCSSRAGSRLGPSHTRELVPKLNVLDIKTSSTPDYALVPFGERPKSTYMSLRMDDVQEAGRSLKQVINGFQCERLMCSTRENVLETPSFQNCSQNSRHILSATGKGGLDSQQKDPVVDIDGLSDESVAQIKERNYTAGGAVEMIGLQEVKVASVPSEEDELEEGEIREANEEIREADEEIGEADEGTGEVQGQIREETEAESMKELGADLLELEEGEIRELETGLDSVDVGNDMICKEENVGTFCTGLESADAAGTSKTCSVSHQTEDDSMGNVSARKVKTDDKMRQDVETNASSAGLASSQLKEFQFPHSALSRDGVICNSLSLQVGGTHDEFVAKQTNDSEASLGNVNSTEVSEAREVFNEVHRSEDDEVANIFIGEETITDNEQHSADVNLDGAQYLAEVASGNADSLEVVEAVVICSAAHQNEHHEGCTSAVDEAVTDNEQHSADARLHGAQCLSKVASGNVESADEVEAAVICSVAHRHEEDEGRTSAGDEAVTDNEQLSADGVVVPHVDTAECGSQVSSCEGHRDELPQTPISEDRHTETSAIQVDTVSRAQQMLDNDSDMRESEAMVDELLNGFGSSALPIGLPIQQPIDGGLSSQADMLSIQGRSEAQLVGTSAEFARMVAPSEHVGQPLPMPPVATFGTLPILYTDPLQLEAQKIFQKMELNARLHNEQMRQYDMDREKAIEAVNRKYVNLVENAVQSNVQRQLSLDIVYHKIRLNCLLANVYRMKDGTSQTLDQGLIAITPVEQPSTSQSWPQQNAFIQSTQNSIPPQRPVQPQVVHHPSQLFANTPAAPIYGHPSTCPFPTVQAGNSFHSTPPHLRYAAQQSFTAPQIPAQAAPAPAPSVHPLFRPVNLVSGRERQGTANLRPLLPCYMSNARLQQSSGAVESRVHSNYSQEVAQSATDGTGHRIIYNLDDD